MRGLGIGGNGGVGRSLPERTVRSHVGYVGWRWLRGVAEQVDLVYT